MAYTGFARNTYTGQVVVTGNLTGFVQDSVLGAVPGNFHPPIISPFGTLGAQIYTAAGAPSNLLGANGDIYINTTNGNYYRKASGVWGSPVGNLTGPQGLQGPQGIPGPPGGPGLTEVTESFTLSGTDITNKYVTLSGVPYISGNLKCAVKGQGSQIYGVDFAYVATRLSWDTLALGTVLVAGDVIQANYWV